VTGFGVTALGQPSLMTAAAAATPRANHDGGSISFTQQCTQRC